MPEFIIGPLFISDEVIANQIMNNARQCRAKYIPDCCNLYCYRFCTD